MKIFLEVEEEEFENLFLNITNNVKKYRKEKGFTQEQLALAIGHSSASMLSKIEAGLENKHFNIRQLYLISKVLDITLSKFFEK
ncbi:MAG: helix-turn-helix transcriptional regulator [Campylobacteraceae bacterium]|nr:helix-turn-helix transcriptional regulator [Campylobacteraceae bacterium]